MRKHSLGIETEFIVDIELLLNTLKSNNVSFIFMNRQRSYFKYENMIWEELPELSDYKKRNLRNKLTLNYLVLKPESSLGINRGWEFNFPPVYSEADIEKIFSLLNSCNPQFPQKAAVHIHISTYKLSKYDIDRLIKWYVENENTVLEEARAVGLYAEGLNANMTETQDRSVPRKTNLNVYWAKMSHNTIEHRIYKATNSFKDLQWCINHTLSIIDRASTVEYDLEKF